MTGGINRVASVFFIPLAEVRGLVHVLDDLPPANAGVVSAEGDFAFLSAVRNDAHFRAAEIVVEEILKPHALDAEHAPDVVGISGVFRLHAIVAIGTRVCRRRFEEIQNLRDRKTFRRLFSVEVSQDRHAQLRIRELFAARGVGDHGDVFHELFVIEKLKQRLELAGVPVDHHQGEDAAVRMAIAGRPTPGRIRALQHVHHAGECRIRRKRIPVTQGLQLSAKLILQIMSHAGRACNAA